VDEMFTIVAEVTRFSWSLALIDEFLLRNKSVSGELLVFIEAIEVEKAVENVTILARFIVQFSERFEPNFDNFYDHMQHIFNFVRFDGSY
jgi:hypothetical protein